MMATQIPNGVTNKLAGESDNPLTNKKAVPMAADGGDAPARRKPSARRTRGMQNGMLSNSLRADRRAGLAATKGRLSVSFSDQKGLSAAQIGDILSGCPDGDGDDKEMSMADLLAAPPDEDDGDKNNRSVSDMKMRMKLMTIQSQRSVTFKFDPKDLEDSEDEDEK